MDKHLLILFVCLASLMLFISCGSASNDQHALSDTPQYIGPHHAHHRIYEDIEINSESGWDSLHAYAPDKSQVKPATRHLPDLKVFGWHMYAHGSRYETYNFSLLWGVAYFGYMVDARTGGYKDIHQWESTALVDSAKAQGCKIFLTVGNYGHSDIKSLLTNKQAQDHLASELQRLLVLRAADGINIDFEGIPAGMTVEFTAFVARLSQYLKKANPEYLVTIALYAVDTENVFDIQALNPHIDLYTLMAYDYYGGFSEIAGPVSPLKPSRIFGEHCMESSIDSYLAKGVKPEKLITSLPLYGANWKTESENVPSPTTDFIRHIPYNTFQKNYIGPMQLHVVEDPHSGDAYYSLMDSGQYQQIWIDDVVSLEKKIQYIGEKNLAGVGFWSLGYGFEMKEIQRLVGGSD